MVGRAQAGGETRWLSVSISKAPARMAAVTQMRIRMLLMMARVTVSARVGSSMSAVAMLRPISATVRKTVL